MVNWLAWKDIDEELVYIKEGSSGEGQIGPNHTRSPGLDRVTSTDEQSPEDFPMSASNLDVVPTGSMTASNVQAALEELHNSPSGGTSEKREITQNSHGFVIPSYGVLPVVFNNTTSSYELAKTDQLNTAADALVTEVIDANTFVINESSIFVKPSHNLNVGEWYIVDNVNQGTLIPSDTFSGAYRQYAIFAIDEDSLLLRLEPVINIAALSGTLIFQSENTNTVLNLNTSTSSLFTTNVPLMGNVVFTDVDFTSTQDSITVDFQGIVKVTFNLHITSATARSALQARIKKNNIPLGPVASSGYIRAASGHNESSLHVTNYYVSVNVGDTISVGSRQEGALGSTTLALPGSSNITVERVS